ncbi:MAG: TauD/TfdA family dioxygenase [Sphingomonadales bacterium]|nr:TauD/TfdA family dioxygenase [Sphingomonadales bacterium]
MALETVDLTPVIGSQLLIDKADLLSGRFRDDIRALLVRRGAVVVRGLHPSDEELRAIAATLGDVRVGGAKRGADGKTLNEGDGGVLKVSLDPDINPDYARFLPGNHLWHMDGSYETTPPFATLFTPYRMATQGGDTLFCSTYAAYEDLPKDEQDYYATLKVVHTMQAALFPAMRTVTPEEFAVWCSYPVTTHPLVWHHKSGRKSLVLSTSASHIEGMHFAKSHDLLESLMRHATQDKYVYRHQWQMGDLAMWDNTGAMHRVTPYDTASRREYHRCTLNGEEPITAVAD